MEYVLLYVDDCLVVSDHSEKMLIEEIGKYFNIKEKSIGPPDVYIGGKMRRVKLYNFSKAWAFSSSQYVVEAVKNVEQYLLRKDNKLNSRLARLFTMDTDLRQKQLMNYDQLMLLTNNH